jgi:hypothetical protein
MPTVRRPVRLTALLVVTLTVGLTATILAATKPQVDPAQPVAARRAQPAQPAAPAAPFPVAGLTAQQTLVGFASDNPRDFATIGAITGLEGDTQLVGIDCRNTNNTVYGLGDRGGIYTLSLQTAAATKVSALTIPLDGQSFDIDFNPAANRLRVISDTGQNLRHNLDDPTGTPPVGVTVADSPLTLPPATQTATGVTGAAYYNNDGDPATATTLFVLDTSKGQVAIQSPANAGLLAATGTLGVDVKAGSDAGFDVHYTPNGASGSTGRGLATLKVNGTWRLYAVELLTGKARLVGGFPAGQQVVDLTAGFRRDELQGILLGECDDYRYC